MSRPGLKNLVAFGVFCALLVLADRGLKSFDEVMITSHSGGWEGSTPLDFGVGPRGIRAQPGGGGDAPATASVENVVLLIADGMGFGHLTLARNAIVGPNRQLAMERAPAVGWVATHGPHRLYIDSASTATTLATGHKTTVGAVGVDADGVSRRSLAEAARDAGRAVGLITDSYLWDATPAAFAAHVAHRNDYEGVARQMAASGFDLLVGGGFEGRGDHVDLFVQDGWRVRDQFDSWRVEALAGESALGIFADLADTDEGPSLLAVTEVAVERLQRNPSGFFLLVETEETDSGSHRNDFDRVVAGLRAFDAVVDWAFDYAEHHGNTLVVVTSDHDTASPVVVSGDAGRPQWIDWSSTSHTAQPVPLFAFGPGAERLAGVRDNTEIAPILASVLGLELEPDLPWTTAGANRDQ